MLGYITDEEFNYRKTNFRMEQENSEIIDIEIDYKKNTLN
jgi:hypothetical protein